jgi:Ca-activated chloride channel family protein
MFEFINPWWLILLIIPISFMFQKNDKKILLMIISSILLIISISRPIIIGKEITIKQDNKNILIGLDISKSMSAKDVFPSRIEVAKKKIKNLIKETKNFNIGIVGFASQSYLIAPFTKDKETLIYLIDNLNENNIQYTGTSYLNLLKTVNDLEKNQDKKILIIFTDGGDKNNFDEEIKFAKKHNIEIYVYLLGTEKGSVLYKDGYLMKDDDGNLIYVKINKKIQKLTEETNGKLILNSVGNKQLKEILNQINIQNKTSEIKIKDNKELFIYPLFLGILILFIVFFKRNKYV